MKYECKCCGNQEYKELTNFFATVKHLVIMCRACIDKYGVDDTITEKIDKLKEEYAIVGCKKGELSFEEFRQSLGLSHLEADDLLKRHGVFIEYDVNEDIEAVRKIDE